MGVIGNRRSEIRNMKEKNKKSIASLEWRRMLIGILFSAFCFLISPFSLQAQPKPDIKRTKTTVTIDGKKFYLHTVESGQTLYAISKAYEVTVDAIVAQ